MTVLCQRVGPPVEGCQCAFCRATRPTEIAASAVEMKQGPSSGQVASAAPDVTDPEAPRADATGQGQQGLAAERNTSAPAPNHQLSADAGGGR